VPQCPAALRAAGRDYLSRFGPAALRDETCRAGIISSAGSPIGRPCVCRDRIEPSRILYQGLARPGDPCFDSTDRQFANSLPHLRRKNRRRRTRIKASRCSSDRTGKARAVSDSSAEKSGPRHRGNALCRFHGPKRRAPGAAAVGIEWCAGCEAPGVQSGAGNEERGSCQALNKGILGQIHQQLPDCRSASGQRRAGRGSGERVRS